MTSGPRRSLYVLFCPDASEHAVERPLDRAQARRAYLDDLSGNPRRIRSERIVRTLFFGAALPSVLVSVLIIGSLAKETITS